MPLPFIPLILGFFTKGKGKLTLILIIALAISSAVGYHFIKVNSLHRQLIDARADVVECMANQARLEDALEVQKQSLARVEQQRQIDQKKLNELSKKYQASNKEVGDLRRMLSKHDLGYLMLRKPGLVENRMNKATDALGRELEELTGGAE